jgi:hypothetical protein
MPLRLTLSIVAMLVCSTAVAAPSPGAPATAQTTVQTYLDQLSNGRYALALSLTDADARRQTQAMLDELKRAEAAHDTDLEVKVRRLALATASATPQRVRIRATFRIDIVAHTWIVSTTAKRIEGALDFVVDVSRAPRIVALEGSLLSGLR